VAVENKNSLKNLNSKSFKKLLGDVDIKLDELITYLACANHPSISLRFSGDEVTRIINEIKKYLEKNR
jgi:hypothetical protein